MTTSHSHWLRNQTTSHGRYRLTFWCGTVAYVDHALDADEDDQPPADACHICKAAYDAVHATAVG